METLLVNLELLEEVLVAIPPDFQLPILNRVVTMARRYMPKLRAHLVVNTPMSMIILKKLKKSPLDECPLLVSIFGDCCKDFLQTIKDSDFCQRSLDRGHGFTVGLMADFEDRVSLPYRNKNQEITDNIRNAESNAAKKLVAGHRVQDQLFREAWNAAKVEKLQCTEPLPEIPGVTQVYNKCEPQLVTNIKVDLEWFELPTAEWQPIITKVKKNQIQRQKAKTPPGHKFPPVTWMDSIMNLNTNDSTEAVVDLTNEDIHPVIEIEDAPIPDDDRAKDSDTSAESHDFSRSSIKRRASTSTPIRDQQKIRRPNPALAKERTSVSSGVAPM